MAANFEEYRNLLTQIFKDTDPNILLEKDFSQAIQMLHNAATMDLSDVKPKKEFIPKANLAIGILCGYPKVLKDARTLPLNIIFTGFENVVDTLNDISQDDTLENVFTQIGQKLPNFPITVHS